MIDMKTMLKKCAAMVLAITLCGSISSLLGISCKAYESPMGKELVSTITKTKKSTKEEITVLPTNSDVEILAKETSHIEILVETLDGKDRAITYEILPIGDPKCISLGGINDTKIMVNGLKTGETCVMVYLNDKPTVRNIVHVNVAETRGKDSSGNSFKFLPSMKADKRTIEFGYIDGYSDGTIRPKQQVTRAEFAILLDRLLDLAPANGTSCPDVKDWWCKDSINSVVAYNILNLKSAKFEPSKPITRAEVAIALSHILDLSRYSQCGLIPDITYNPAKNQISQVVDAGLMRLHNKDDNSFLPNDTVSRAEIVEILNKVFIGDNAKLKNRTFSDLDKTQQCYNNMLMAVIELQ